MTRTEEQIAVMQAFVAGKTIEHRYGRGDEWSELGCPTWNWAVYDYRVKPEPQVRYVNVYKVRGATTREEANRFSNPNRIACVRMEFTEGQFDD